MTDPDLPPRPAQSPTGAADPKAPENSPDRVDLRGDGDGRVTAPPDTETGAATGDGGPIDADAEAALDAAFAVLRTRALSPSEALVARVLDDAAAVHRQAVADMPEAPAHQTFPLPPQRRGPGRGTARTMRRPTTALWRAVRVRLVPAGLGAALAAGFALGAVAPAVVFDPIAAFQDVVLGPPLVLDFANAADLLQD